MTKNTAAGSPPAQPSPVPEIPSPASGLEAWFATHVQNSAIAMRTDLYNRIHHAKEALRRLLAEIVEML